MHACVQVKGREKRVLTYDNDVESPQTRELAFTHTRERVRDKCIHHTRDFSTESERGKEGRERERERVRISCGFLPL